MLISPYLQAHNQQPEMFNTSLAAEIIVIEQERCRKNNRGEVTKAVSVTAES